MFRICVYSHAFCSKAVTYLRIGGVNWSPQALLYLALRLSYLRQAPSGALTFLLLARPTYGGSF